MNNEPISCTVENAPKFAEWCRSRGGVARWRSANLSNPGASWSTPANSLEGTPTVKPTWQAEEKPELIETDPNKILVFKDKEVKRFHVAIHRGGMSFKCTDKSSAKIRAEVEKAGKDAYYEFNYDTQEAVILAPDVKMTLTEWMKNNPDKI